MSIKPLALVLMLPFCDCAPLEDLQPLQARQNVNLTAPTVTFEENLQIGIKYMRKDEPTAKLASVHAIAWSTNAYLTPVDTPEELNKIELSFWTDEEDRWLIYSFPNPYGSWGIPRKGRFSFNSGPWLDETELKCSVREAMGIARSSGRVSGGLTALRVFTDDSSKKRKKLPPRYRLWFKEGNIAIDATDGRILELESVSWEMSGRFARNGTSEISISEVD